MAKNWVVVADRSTAKIFLVATPTGKLQDLETLKYPKGRMRAREIDADRPGRAFQSAGSQRHGMERASDVKKQEAMAFARQIASRLEGARLQNGLARLILVAPPEFLGLLRDNLSAETRELVQAEFDLNLTAMKPSEIRAHLPEKLFTAINAR
jgi:protein required for attachment to host cells